MTVLAQVGTCLSLTMLAGFAGDLALQQSADQQSGHYLFQHLLKDRRHLPASSRLGFLARDCTSAMVSLSLLGWGSPG